MFSFQKASGNSMGLGTVTVTGKSLLVVAYANSGTPRHSRGVTVEATLKGTVTSIAASSVCPWKCTLASDDLIRRSETQKAKDVARHPSAGDDRTSQRLPGSRLPHRPRDPR